MAHKKETKFFSLLQYYAIVWCAALGILCRGTWACLNNEPLLKVFGACLQGLLLGTAGGIIYGMKNARCDFCLDEEELTLASSTPPPAQNTPSIHNKNIIEKQKTTNQQSKSLKRRKYDRRNI